MKKIPTLFTRIFDNRRIVDITPEITPGCEEAFLNGRATVKIDSSCCTIIGDEFYKRYDAKKGKTPPVGAIPCSDPDPVTGHWPHWVKVDENDPSDKWFVKAFKNSIQNGMYYAAGTYEVIGPHFQGNPYGLAEDILEPHGFRQATVKRDFDSVKEWLRTHNEEGLVFWLNGEPVCKIKRTDFGYEWPVTNKED